MPDQARILYFTKSLELRAIALQIFRRARRFPPGPARNELRQIARGFRTLSDNEAWLCGETRRTIQPMAPLEPPIRINAPMSPSSQALSQASASDENIALTELSRANGLLDELSRWNDERTVGSVPQAPRHE